MRTTFAVVALVLVTVTATAADPRPVAAPFLGPGAFSSESPSIASRGGAFLTAWKTDTLLSAERTRIDGRPITSDGRAATSAARILTAATRRLGSILPYGDHYLLLSYDERTGESRFVELSQSGDPIGVPAFAPQAIAVSNAFANADASRLLLVRYEAGLISATIVDSSGNVVRSGITLAVDSRDLGGVSSVDRGFLLFRTSPSGILMQRISETGDLDPTQLALDDRPSGAYLAGPSPVAAEGDGKLAVAWPTGAGPTGDAGRTSVAIVSGGTIVRPIDIPSEGFRNPLPLSLFWTGDHFLLLLTQSYCCAEPMAIVAIRLSADGELLDPQPVIVARRESGSYHSTAAAWNGRFAYVVGIERPAAPMPVRVVGTVVRSDGGIRAEASETLSILPARQDGVAAASDGASSLVAWREHSGDRTSIRTALVSRGGDVSSVRTLADVTGLTGEPEVAYGGGMYLVVWHYWTHLLAVRLLPDGTPLDATPLTVYARTTPPSALLAPAVVWAGTHFAVVWTEPQIMGVTFSPAGTATAATEIVRGGSPAIAWNGQRLLLAFEEYTVISPFPGHSTLIETKTIALSADLQRLTSEPVNHGQMFAPRLAAKGAGFLLVAHPAWSSSQGDGARRERPVPPSRNRRRAVRFIGNGCRMGWIGSHRGGADIHIRPGLRLRIESRSRFVAGPDDTRRRIGAGGREVDRGHRGGTHLLQRDGRRELAPDVHPRERAAGRPPRAPPRRAALNEASSKERPCRRASSGRASGRGRRGRRCGRSRAGRCAP